MDAGKAAKCLIIGSGVYLVGIGLELRGVKLLLFYVWGCVGFKCYEMGPRMNYGAICNCGTPKGKCICSIADCRWHGRFTGARDLSCPTCDDVERAVQRLASIKPCSCAECIYKDRLVALEKIVRIAKRADYSRSAVAMIDDFLAKIERP